MSNIPIQYRKKCQGCGEDFDVRELRAEIKGDEYTVPGLVDNANPNPDYCWTCHMVNQEMSYDD